MTLITDAFGRPLLEAGCDHWGLPRTLIVECPLDADSLDAPERWSHAPECCHRTDAWIDTLFASGPGARWSHLVAIERPGPSHTAESLAAQTRTGPAPLDVFERDVPADERDVCHNMRGGRITGYTAKTHRLFERIGERQLPITTIGIGDGGNEIGLGGIPWETLRAAIAVGPSALVPSRIATDHLLLAGVSDWGGYALAAATCAVAGRAELLRPWTAASQAELVKTLVREAGAVDGVVRRPQATVDGLPMEMYLDPLEKIRELCGS